MILIPIPVMMKYMLTGRSAYRGILEGSLTAMTGVTIVFIMFWSMTGVSFFHVLNTALSQITIKDMQLSGYYMMGMKQPEADTLQLALDQMKQMTKLAVPGTIIVFSMIIAYLNYGVISWMIGKTGKKISKLPPFRVFSLPKSIVLGSLLIYALSYITISTGIISKDLIMFNLELLFTFIFLIQGLAVVFYFGYFKRIPKIITLIVAGIFLFTWIGQTFLFLLGLTDVVLDIRKRFSQMNLKI